MNTASGAPWSTDLERAILEELRGIRDELRDAQAPFRARPFRFFANDAVTVSATAFGTHETAVQFGPGVTVVPDGWAGKVTRAMVVGRNDGGAALPDASIDLEWQFSVRARPVAGLHAMAATNNVDTSDDGVTVIDGIAPPTPPHELPAPLWLGEGDDLLVRYRDASGGASSMLAAVHVWGYLFPLAYHADGVRGSRGF